MPISSRPLRKACGKLLRQNAHVIRSNFIKRNWMTKTSVIGVTGLSMSQACSIRAARIYCCYSERSVTQKQGRQWSQRSKEKLML